MKKSIKSKKQQKTGAWTKWGTILFNFISMMENLPYGASLIQEKRVARAGMGTGVLVMAFGAAFFSVGWKFHITWLVETAFVITLVGWMMVILGFAFGVVGWAAKHIPILKSKTRK